MMRIQGIIIAVIAISLSGCMHDIDKFSAQAEKFKSGFEATNAALVARIDAETFTSRKINVDELTKNPTKLYRMTGNPSKAEAEIDPFVEYACAGIDAYSKQRGALKVVNDYAHDNFKNLCRSGKFTFQDMEELSKTR